MRAIYQLLLFAYDFLPLTFVGFAPLYARLQRKGRMTTVPNVKFHGNDRVFGNTEMLKESWRRIGADPRSLEVVVGDVSGFNCGDGAGWENIAVVNPPWPEGRLSPPDLKNTWQDLGDWFKRTFKSSRNGGEMWILAPTCEIWGELRMRREKAGRKFRQGRERMEWRQYKVYNDP